MEAAACIFTGYAPSSWDIYNVSTFIIFGFVAPIAILFILFYEFTGGLISHTGAHRVLALVIALMAYRGLLATLFIDLLTYGFAGIGVLLVDYLIFGILYNLIKKTWKWREAIEEELQIAELAELERLKEKRDELQRAWTALKTSPIPLTPEDEKKMKEYEKKMKEIDETLKKLSSKIK